MGPTTFLPPERHTTAIGSLRVPVNESPRIQCWSWLKPIGSTESTGKFIKRPPQLPLQSGSIAWRSIFRKASASCMSRSTTRPHNRSVLSLGQLHWLTVELLTVDLVSDPSGNRKASKSNASLLLPDKRQNSRSPARNRAVRLREQTEQTNALPGYPEWE